MPLPIDGNQITPGLEHNDVAHAVERYGSFETVYGYCMIKISVASRGGFLGEVLSDGKILMRIYSQEDLFRVVSSIKLFISLRN